MEPRTTEKPSPPSEPNKTFTSLSDLASNHFKSSKKKSDGFEIPDMKFNVSKKSETSSFSSLADLTAHHLSNSPNQSSSNFIIPNIETKTSNFIIPNIETKRFDSKTPTLSCLADLAAHHLKISESRTIPEFPVKIKQEKLDLLSDDVSNLNLSKIDKNVTVKVENTVNSQTEAVLTEIHSNCPNSSRSKLTKKASAFGRVLCKNYKRKRNERKEIVRMREMLHPVVHFDFSSPSPDSVILSRLNRKIF